MFKIAIDLGYGYVKGINELGKTVLIRTAIGSGVDRQIATVFGNAGKSKEHIVISQNDVERQYFIGNLARKESRDCSSPFEKNKIDSPSTRVILAAATAMLSEGNTEPIHIVTGPPLLYAAEQRESFKKTLSDYHSTLRFVGDEKFHVVKFGRVSVFPQGAAVVYHLIKEYPELYKPGRSFAIVEAGYKTTEILVFEIGKNGKIITNSGYSTTLEQGMNLVEKALDEAFFQKAGGKLIPSVMDRVMYENPVINYNSKEIDLEDARNGAKDELVRNIIDGISQVLGEQLGFLDKLIFAGGVVQDEYISNQLRKTLKKDFIIIEDSQFSNAKGMLEVAKLIEDKEQRTPAPAIRGVV